MHAIAFYVSVGCSMLYCSALLSGEVERFTFVGAVVAEPQTRDNATGLVWQTCTVGQSGPTCGGNGVYMSWQDALHVCQTLAWGGHDDWYLPNAKELISILDIRKSQISVDAAAFPHTSMQAYYWTSTTVTGNPKNAWTAYYGDGKIVDSKKTMTFLVRCVRRAEPSLSDGPFLGSEVRESVATH